MNMVRRGFTAIELVMAVLVSGALALAILAGVSSASRSSRLMAAKLKLRSDILYAQSLAVTQQLNHGIIFSPPQAYSVYSQDTSDIVNNPLTGNAFTVDYSADSNLEGVTLSPELGSPNTNRLEFDMLGTPYSGPSAPLVLDGSVTLSLGGESVVLTITKNTGKVD